MHVIHMVDETRLDEMGVDEMSIRRNGIRRTGTNPIKEAARTLRKQDPALLRTVL